ncbi:MAG: DUF599 family protein [Xanthobacteraceae bacterium]|nr:DUF599 family protein [Xanthobacteraceae bacterium]QYK46648.1 MAG: DUF599 family protein [Xanthobacteraceae bacterium]HMN51772.1 DUF599 family protein [Xanthobacteraceae bacterium]
MFGLSPVDIGALGWFLLAWTIHAVIVERSEWRLRSLNYRMDLARHEWMLRMLSRDVRIVDTQIMASLHQGTAFFASTSLFAIGGALALLRSSGEVMDIFRALPFAMQSSRTVFEVKVVGLLVIFVYAFFKFAWSYRLFNYVAIQIGATPPASSAKSKAARDHVERIARMITIAGRHFNRGQRAIFFALAYLGWFVSGYVLAFTTAAVLFVILMRQFGSTARWLFGEK